MSQQIIIKVHNDSSCIEGVLSKICIDQIKFATSYAIPGAHFSKAFQNGFWNGRSNLFSLKDQSFPTGLLSKVRAVLTQNNTPFVVKDCRVKPKPSLDIIFTPKVTLRPYQVEAISLSPVKQRGIIRIATGGGKSYCIAGIVGTLKVPTLVLVHKRDIFWQLIETLEQSLGVPVGKIGAGVVDPQNITVGMIQTVARLFDPKIKVDKEDDTEINNPEELQQFIKSIQCVIVDETHHINEGQYTTALSNCNNAFYRFGLSATPFRTDQADIVIEAFTGPKFIDISASYLIEQGYLAAPTIYLVSFKHKKQPSEIKYAQLYAAEIVQNSSRNALIVDLVRKAVESGKTVLIAVSHINHGKILEERLKEIEPTTFFAHGQVDSQTRQQVLKDLDSGVRKIVISTTVFGEGVDVPNLSVLINAKAAESAVDSLQLVGRVLRKTTTKDKATVIDITDEGCRFFGVHAQSRTETYKTEPKYDIKEVKSLSEVTF